MVFGLIITFVVALLVGGLGIHLGARAVTDVDDYGYAVGTALYGAIALAVVSWIPLIGLLIGLVVWIGLINWRYPGGWVQAAVIGIVAWLAAAIILGVLNGLLRLGLGAFGIPGI
ncbi:hypothetical protein [Halodesulfurarchaeum sp.]|uniref:hypothetical protein n=1 Tax=Halodesulfurarchaeum sp. TaxID=1980530 RepID=UPI002FC31970